MNTEPYQKINTGDWVGGKWDASPHWTPYAQAIADFYPNQVPWYLTMPTTLTGVAGQRRTVKSSAQQHDVLIFGAHISVQASQFGDFGQQVYLQITHDQTGIPWVINNVLAYAPLTAFGGTVNDLGNSVMNVSKFPEAFFLPKNTKLKFDFTNGPTEPITGGTVTLVGVQLTHPANPNTPEFVTMPNGESVRVGSRQPWFSTIGFGERSTTGAAGVTFTMQPGEQFVQFLPPSDCFVEIHDIHCNFFLNYGGDTTPDTIMVKITDMGSHQQWTPNLSPITGVFGDFRQVYPQLPLNKPYILPKGHRLQLLMQDNRAGVSLDVVNPLVTIRGVRLCDY